MNEDPRNATLSAPMAPDWSSNTSDQAREFRQALLVWTCFFVLVVLINGTIPFALGVDLRAWTQSPIKSLLIGFLFYSVMCLAVPLLLIKGWATLRRPDFLLPLLVAMLGITFWRDFRLSPALAVAVLAYLNWRFDLSRYGIRSRGWKGDLLAVLIMGVLGLVPLVIQARGGAPALGSALGAGLSRLFMNPASTVENLFYFGFLAERLSYRAGKWLTPLLIAAMYTAHEMSNPEYWYGGTAFGFIFVGVAIWTVLYLWRRSAVVVWLGDGLYRFVMSLF